MEPKRLTRAANALFLCALLLASLVVPPPARADEPMLAIRLIEGESAVYAASEIERIGLEGEGEETLVVVSPGRSDYYPAASGIEESRRMILVP